MNPHGVELYCPECGAQVAPGRSAEPCAACGYGSAPCTHDPTTTVGAIGMYHCPECGDMVIAGCPHV